METVYPTGAANCIHRYSRVEANSFSYVFIIYNKRLGNRLSHDRGSPFCFLKKSADLCLRLNHIKKTNGLSIVILLIVRLFVKLYGGFTMLTLTIMPEIPKKSTQ